MGVLGRSGRRWWGGMVQAEVTQIGQEPLWGGKRSGASSGHRASWTWTTLSLPPPRPTASHAFLDFHRSLTAVIILTSQMVNIATLFSLAHFSTMLVHNLTTSFNVIKSTSMALGTLWNFFYFFKNSMSSWATTNTCCVEYRQSDRQRGLNIDDRDDKGSCHLLPTIQFWDERIHFL